MPKQLACQNREESAVGRVAINQQTSQTRQTPTTTNSKPATHRLGSFAFQPYQLFNPTPYAANHKLVDGCDDVISNGSNHSKSSDSKELPINLMMTNKNAKVDRMSICSDVSSSDNETTRQPSNNIKSLSPPSLATVQKNCHPPTVTTHVPSPVTTHHLGSTPSFGQPNTVVPQIKLPPTSMYPYTKQQTPIDNISPPTIIQPLPPIPSINSMRSLVGLSPKVQKQGFASPKVKAKKGLSAHLTTNNFSAVVNSGSTKSFGSSTSTTQNFYASPMKSVDNSNPYTISSLTTQSTQNENVNQTNIINPNQTPEKKEAPLAVKPIPKLPFGTLSLMN